MDKLALKKKLSEKAMYRSKYECNYVLSHQNLMACFTTGAEKYSGIFCITDTEFNPIFEYHANAYIHACSISDSGVYSVFATASSPDNSDENSVFFFKACSLLWKKKLEISVTKNVSFIFPNERVGKIFLYRGFDEEQELSCVFDFEGTKLEQ